MTPVDFKAFAGRRFHPHKGTGGSAGTYPLQVLAQDRDAAFIALLAQALGNDDGAGAGIFLQQLADPLLVRVQFAGSGALDGRRGRLGEILAHALTADFQMAGDLAYRPALTVTEPVDGFDVTAV